MTLEEVKVEPGGGSSITAGPVDDSVGVAVGVGVALGVGVELPPGVAVGVGVGVGVGAAEQVENLNEPIRVSQFRP